MYVEFGCLEMNFTTRWRQETRSNYNTILWKFSINLLTIVGQITKYDSKYNAYVHIGSRNSRSNLDNIEDAKKYVDDTLKSNGYLELPDKLKILL